jgi:two-component system sensor histidine kinase PilS (NtrC family)
VRLQQAESRFNFQRSDLLRWIYLGRLALVSGILVGAILVWSRAAPTQTLVATILFLVSLIVTAPSVWYTSLREGQPGDKFVYLQVLFDILLVTSVVHITGGGESPFAFVYILVISAGALLLPLPGGVLVGVLAAILFFADTVWLHADTLRLEVILQIALFSTVAVVTGWLGDRVRRAGLALGEVESALRLLQLGTGDILGNIATGVLTVDGGGRLVYLNPAGEAFLGLRFEQWQGVEVLEAVNDIAPGMATVLRSSMETSVPVARSKTLAERGGVEMVLGVSTTVLEREDGGTPSVTAIFQDITDQERLSALHRRNERLEAVAELSASLAHEIKNPLASIRSAVEQLSGNSLDGEDEHLLQRLVVTESDRLSRLLSDFIDFSALRMGNAREVDLAGLARDCITLVSRHPDVREGVRFQEVGMDREVRVPGDADLLHRAVFNLVLNAAQFAGPAGIVCVEVQDREECAASVGNAVQDPVCLKVADSGPGVEPEEMPRIFDPFFTGRPGGSGLGLAVVHRAVEAHRGMVLVDRGRDGGAEFSIYLPGTRAAEREEAS